MRIFLTGGTGFLGKRLAARLAGAGHQVRALVRPTKTPRVMPEGVDAVPGDMLDRESLERGAEGADTIVHTAALVKMWVPDRSLFDRVNVAGLETILDIARGSAARVIYTSSFIALGPTDGRIGDESWRLPGRSFNNDYERTKAVADRVARSAADQGIDITILYPGVVYGAGEMTDGSLMTRTIRDFMRRKVPFLGSGHQKICYSFIDDVVEGHLLALEKETRGERYILGGENADYHHLFGILSRLTGAPVPRLHLPFWTMSLAGRVLRWRAGLTGAEPPLTDEVVNIYRHDWAFSSDKATRELGYRITPLEEGLRRTVEWLRSQG